MTGSVSAARLFLRIALLVSALVLFALAQDCRRLDEDDLYQLEVKRWLVAHQFTPAQGWRVRVDVHAAERGLLTNRNEVKP